MSDFTPQQDNELNVSLEILNERVSAAASEYINYLEQDEEGDIISNLQDALVDVVAIASVAFTALDKLNKLKEEEQE